ncbi:hypothetical protein MMC28_010071 [Mycoblastus sanguinarius]|nr:hypothetical protein [Mycoblastus sanguinarius]
MAVQQVFASPYPQASPPCVPQYQITGDGELSGQYTSIPLGPGESYCDGSAASAAASGPTDGDGDCDNGDDEGADKRSDIGTSSANAKVATGNNGTSQTSSGSGAQSGASIGSSNSTSADPSSPSTSGQGKTYQATITGYGGNCANAVANYGSCGFLGAQNSFQAAMSTYWNSAGLPGQCGTCWKLTDGSNINGDNSRGSLIGTAPIVVMVDNTCAKYPSKPTGAEDGFQCHQDAQNPVDKFGSVTVVDLCIDRVRQKRFGGRVLGRGRRVGWPWQILRWWIVPSGMERWIGGRIGRSIRLCLGVRRKLS